MAANSPSPSGNSSSPATFRVRCSPFIVSGPGLIAPFEKESADLEQRQQQFIAEFPKDRATLYYEYSDRATLLDHIRKMELPINVSAGVPQNLLYSTLGTLFKGRAQFLEDLPAQLKMATARCSSETTRC